MTLYVRFALAVACFVCANCSANATHIFVPMLHFHIHSMYDLLCIQIHWMVKISKNKKIECVTMLNEKCIDSMQIDENKCVK